MPVVAANMALCAPRNVTPVSTPSAKSKRFVGTAVTAESTSEKSETRIARTALAISEISEAPTVAVMAAIELRRSLSVDAFNPTPVSSMWESRSLWKSDRND